MHIEIQKILLELQLWVNKIKLNIFNLLTGNNLYSNEPPSSKEWYLCEESHFLKILKSQSKWKISQFYEQPYSCNWEDWLDLFNKTDESVTLYKHTQCPGEMMIVPPGYYHIIKYVRNRLLIKI